MSEQQQYTHDQIVGRYLELRNEKDQINAEAKAKVADIERRLQVIEGFLLATLTASGVESMRTQHGTCYKHIKTTVSVGDKETFIKSIKERDDLTLLTIAANKTRVLEILEETGVMVPGLNISRTTTVGIRKGNSVGS